MVQTIDQVRRNNDITMIALLASQIFFYSVLFVLLWNVIKSYKESRQNVPPSNSQAANSIYSSYILLATMSALMVILSAALLFFRFFMKPGLKDKFWKTGAWKLRRFAADFFDFTGPSMTLLIGVQVVNVIVLFFLLALAYANSTGASKGLAVYFKNTENLPLVSLGATLVGFVLGIAKLSGTKEYQVLYNNPLTRSTSSRAWEKTKRGGKYGYKKAGDILGGAYNLTGSALGGVYNAAETAIDAVRGRYQV